MKHKLALTFLALSLCAAAQTTSAVSGVVLSGDSNNSTITNKAGKQIIAVQIAHTLSDGLVGMEFRFFTDTPNELPDGGSRAIGRYDKKRTEIAAKVTAAIFADGELRGDGEANSFSLEMERRFQSMRQVWQMAKDGNWDGVKVAADWQSSVDMSARALAQRMLKAERRTQNGVEAYKHISLLPTTTWKGSTLLNWLKGAPFIYQLAQWLVPESAFAQSRPYCCVGTYPYAVYNPPHFPSMWSYYCSTYLGSGSDTCPSLGQQTPFLGIKAECYDNGGYWIAVKTNASVDVFNLTVFNGANQSSQGPNYNLSSGGSCVDNDNVYPTEYWDYENYCRGGGSGNIAPIKYNDGTGTICGASNLGYGG